MFFRTENTSVFGRTLNSVDEYAGLIEGLNSHWFENELV
jgi:hypothetical protein